MQYIQLDCLTPESYLTYEEALLDECEANPLHEITINWEAKFPFIVLGYANKFQQEVNLDICKRQNIPVLRRISGGGTVLQGPGCLSYALILKIPSTGLLSTVVGTNQYIMERMKQILQPLCPEAIQVQGTTDLTIGNRKFSGNSQRRRKSHLLFHGTILYAAQWDLIESVLLLPGKQPEYRKQRTHREFMTDFPATKEDIIKAIRKGWKAETCFPDNIGSLVKNLISNKYATNEWNYKY
jgi:lipoate-protein ligase A